MSLYWLNSLPDKDIIITALHAGMKTSGSYGKTECAARVVYPEEKKNLKNTHFDGDWRALGRSGKWQ